MTDSTFKVLGALPTKRAVNSAVGRRPRLLDLFCGAGGVAVGYDRAGFEVVGVDIHEQPRYPFMFHRGGALGVLRRLLRGESVWGYLLTSFDVIHASPPCQGYTLIQNFGGVRKSPRLIAATRDRLVRAVDAADARGHRLMWVLENVVTQETKRDMQDPVLICGASFGLGAAGLDLPRHRYFASSEFLLVPQCQHRRGKTLGVYGHGTNKWHREKLGRNITMAERREAMGIDWMRRGEDSEAIPPAYTEFIGKQLIASLDLAA